MKQLTIPAILAVASLLLSTSPIFAEQNASSQITPVDVLPISKTIAKTTIEKEKSKVKPVGTIVNKSIEPKEIKSKLKKVVLKTKIAKTETLKTETPKKVEKIKDMDFLDSAATLLKKSVKLSDNAFYKKLYPKIFFTPVWVDENGLSAFGTNLMKLIATDKTLLPSMKSSKLYRKLKEKLKTLNSKSTNQERIDIELEASSVYKAYVDYIIFGGINWSAFKNKLSKLKDIQAGWVVYLPKRDPATILVDAIMSGDLENGILEAEPKRFKYAKLKKYLIKYIDISHSEKWQTLPKFSKKLKAGAKSKAIPAIRNNLQIVGDLKECIEEMNSTVYDKCLEKAVKRFQLRNGLKGDGVIGKGTYRILSISLAKKIKLIRMNLDRIKRLRQKEGKIRMELNIPSYRLNFYEGESLMDSIRVVVGKRKRPTPSFGDKVEYIIVNPWWKIPESIVKKEMIRHLVKDPYYYERRGKVLHATWSENSERIDPGSVDWESYAGGRNIPYRFMQVPGNRNALGKIKFIFPNRFSVYIHDTPSKRLFFRTDRAFSHGCMRIQKPRELLTVFARYNDNIDVPAIMKRLEGTEKKVISLKTKVPVDITYLTAFVDDYGNLNFRKDVYGYDRYTLDSYNYKVDRYKTRVLADVKSKNGKAVKSKEKKEEYKTSEVYPK